ncbi:MAG: glycosyltransferase family 1 protein [Acidimicrobiales bacterium]|nr:glycosyltransferase family 1 protein [Acidimicrobiales bacterium]
MRVAIPFELCWHDVPGGTARSAIDLAAALDRRDDVEVVGVAARHRAPPAPAWRPTVRVHQLPLPRLLLYETWHGLRRPRVEAATGPVDLLHVAGAAVAASRAPMVVTVHDLAWRHHPDYFTRHGLRFFRRALRLVVDEAAIVFVPSMATLDDCVDAGLDRGRLRHVPWGVDVPSDDPGISTAEVRARFGIHGDYVVTVGTLEPRKNLRGLLRAWQVLDRDDVTLVVVGPEGWGDVVEPSAVPDRVVRTGFVDREVRDALYRGAVASVYPSVFEGFGLPVLESMALGCPVVTSAGTSCEELVSGGAGLAVDPHDPERIAAGLAELLDDAELRARVVAAGFERAAGHTWERAAQQVVEGYRDAVEAGVRP